MIQDAVNNFNNNNFDEAEKVALKILEENSSSNEAVDVLAAIFLKVGKLNFLGHPQPKHLPIIRQIAVMLEDLKTYEHAIICYSKALELDPNDSIAYNNLGLIYEEIENVEKSISCYLKSISIKNNYPADYNLGVLYRKLNDLANSEKYLEKAIALQPLNQYACYALGMTYLKGRNFKKGYPYFLERPIIGKEKLQNIWTGEKHPDKTLLVFCEYGFGDAIMFSRYFSLLKNYFKNIKVCARQALIPLFEKNFPDIEFVPTIINVEYDYSTFLMDLPYRLKLDFDNIPFNEGYLKPDVEKAEKYKKEYFNTDLKKVGIFYVGGELEKRNAKYRAVELKKLEKLFDLKNCKFYSFQVEDIFNELDNFPQIVNLGKTFNDFSDTLAAMKNLDLMITIDSVPVHLAGAIGLKTLLMLPKYSEWRWFSDTSSTPWYNSVEIIKQEKACDWEDVVEKIYNKIKE
ncbi:MAG: tetratricopeptide repeat protein [Candidatus Gastranaerophilales bacterium]|nr:tetratricopeptide repeat protein [Candidatus Gastranaerophilales bacterium]